MKREFVVVALISLLAAETFLAAAEKEQKDASEAMGDKGKMESPKNAPEPKPKFKGSGSMVTFDGPITKKPVTFGLYLPPDYETSGLRYPVMYMLHGNGGKAAVWPDFVVALEKAVAEGVVCPMIAVFPDGYKDSVWADSFDMKTPAETNVIRELIPYIDVHYRTIASREARVVSGFSMGGFGSLEYAFKFPDTFCCAVSYCAAVNNGDPSAGPSDWPCLQGERGKRLFNGDPKNFDAYSPWLNAAANADAIRKSVAMRMTVGTRDTLLSSNRLMRDKLAKLNIPVEYVEVPDAGHCEDFPVEGRNGLKFIASHINLKAVAEQKPSAPIDHGKVK